MTLSTNGINQTGISSDAYSDSTATTLVTDGLDQVLSDVENRWSDFRVGDVVAEFVFNNITQASTFTLKIRKDSNTFTNLNAFTSGDGLVNIFEGVTTPSGNNNYYNISVDGDVDDNDILELTNVQLPGIPGAPGNDGTSGSSGSSGTSGVINLTNSGDNRIITDIDGSSANAERSLQFDGSILTQNEEYERRTSEVLVNAGNTGTLISVSTTDYLGLVIDYTLLGNDGRARFGTVRAIFDSSSIVLDEVTSTDLNNSTDAITFNGTTGVNAAITVNNPTGSGFNITVRAFVNVIER